MAGLVGAGVIGTSGTCEEVGGCGAELPTPRSQNV